MLRTMRDDFKKYSWTLWLVIIAFVLGFLLTDAFGPKTEDKSGLVFFNNEAMVRGDEFQELLMRRLDSYKGQFKNNFNKNLIAQLRVPEQILQSLINAAVIRSEAKKLGISATKDELKQKILTYPGFQQDGKFVGLANYHRALQYNRIKVEEFESQLMDEIVSEKFQALVTGTMVLDAESLKEQFIKEKDNAEVDFIRLKTDLVKEAITLADDDPAISEYYEKHKEDFKSQEQRAAYVIAYNFDDYKKEVTVDEKDVYEFFKTNKAEYMIEGKTKVSRILLKYEAANRDEIFKNAQALQQELTAENFAEKAKTVSQDDKAAAGGDHGYFAWKQFTSQEVSIIEGLPEGQISTPIDTQTGFSILYVPEKIERSQQAYNDVKDKIRESLESEKVNALVTEKLQKIHAKLKDAENIKAKAAELNVTAVETDLMTAGRPIKDVDQMGYISRKLFQMKEKETAFPVNFVKGLAIVQISKIEKPVVEAFDLVKDKVKANVITAKKLDLLTAKAKAYADELNNITDDAKREEYLKTNNLTQDFAAYKKGNTLSNLPVKDGLDEIIFSSELKKFNDPLTFDNEVVIYKLKNKTIATDEDFNKERNEYYQKKISEIRNSYFASYMADRKQSYTVTMNNELFNEIKDAVVSRFN